MLRIEDHKDGVLLDLPDIEVVREWIDRTIKAEGYEPGTWNLIFVTDSALLEMNQKYLNHDYFTDVITFDYSSGKNISGDIFISIDRVKENASTLNIWWLTELHRVMIHGVLHLCGYQDKTPDDRKRMRKKEDYYLSLLA